jgi:hypothetical protein
MHAFVVGLLTLLLAIATPVVASAAEDVDLELVLLADSSGSIDAHELNLQRQGYMDALRHPQVLAAIAGGPRGRIAVTYVEWADMAHQSVLVPWMVIDGKGAAERFGDVLRDKPRTAWGPNAIGAALAAGQRLIETNAYEGDRKVIDFSADSANSWNGVPVRVARDQALAAGIVINGLAITCRDLGCSGRPIGYDLEEAFRQTITGGPGSFVLTVDGTTTFEEAVRRKLVIEMSDRQLPTARATRFADAR